MSERIQESCKTPDRVANSRRYAAVGCCIYCRRTGDLTDEHIVPYALAGKLVLPESSCEACAKITSHFERRVLRGFMFPARILAEFPTRKMKNRPNSLPLRVQRSGRTENAELPLPEAVGVLHMPIYAAPGFLENREVKGVAFFGFDTVFFGRHPIEVLQNLEASKISFESGLEYTSFARMLAKIAYSYAVGVLGLERLKEVFVLPGILGEKDDLGTWVGSYDPRWWREDEVPTQVIDLKAMRHGRLYPDERLILARIKLFASSAAHGGEAELPTYRVVVGTLQA